MIAIAILLTLILCAQILICALLHQVIAAISALRLNVSVVVQKDESGGFSDN